MKRIFICIFIISHLFFNLNKTIAQMDDVAKAEKHIYDYATNKASYDFIQKKLLEPNHNSNHVEIFVSNVEFNKEMTPEVEAMFDKGLFKDLYSDCDKIKLSQLENFDKDYSIYADYINQFGNTYDKHFLLTISPENDTKFISHYYPYVSYKTFYKITKKIQENPNIPNNKKGLNTISKLQEENEKRTPLLHKIKNSITNFICPI